MRLRESASWVNRSSIVALPPRRPRLAAMADGESAGVPSAESARIGRFLARSWVRLGVEDSNLG